MGDVLCRLTEAACLAWNGKQVKSNQALWAGLLGCIMETLVPEEASKNKLEVEGEELDEVRRLGVRLR